MTGRHLTIMTIDDAPHYSQEERQRIIESYPAHEREARARGVPVLGSGRVFPVEESALSVSAFPVPSHWAVIAGMDFGWDHPFAAVSLAWDRECDIVYVTGVYRIRNETPLVHAATLKAWGKVCFAWPHDGLQHEKGSGKSLADLYRSHGLDLLPDKATHPAGGFSLEAGIFDLLERMRTGRFRVFAHLQEWFEEFRLYHRKDGRVVKERDDLMSATRMAHMMLRYARAPEIGSWEEAESPQHWVV